MESTTNAADGNSPRVDDGGSKTLNALFDVLVSLLIVVPGVGLASAGVAVYRTADPATSEEIVADVTVTSTIVSEAVLTDAIYEMMVWGGIGLVLTGLALTVAGAGFLWYCRRLRGRRGDTDAVLRDGTVLVVLGAVVTSVTSFLPFSPLVGGGVAGYVQRGGTSDGLRIGALAGLAFVTPLAILVVFLLGGALAADAAPIALLLAGFLAVAATVTVVLSAIGGYAGSVLADSER